MKRGAVETSACVDKESGDHGSEGKRVRQNYLTDRLYFNKVSFISELFKLVGILLALYLYSQLTIKRVVREELAKKHVRSWRLKNGKEGEGNKGMR